MAKQNIILQDSGTGPIVYVMSDTYVGTKYRCYTQIGSGYPPHSIWSHAITISGTSFPSIAVADASGNLWSLQPNATYTAAWNNIGTGQPHSIASHIVGSSAYLALTGDGGTTYYID